MQQVNNNHQAEDPWILIKSEHDWISALDRSFEKPVAILKHWDNHSLSAQAISRLEQEASKFKMYAEMYLLDIANCKNTADLIAREVGIKDASPQLLIIKKGKVIHHSSGGDISPEFAISALQD